MLSIQLHEMTVTRLIYLVIKFSKQKMTYAKLFQVGCHLLQIST